MQKEVAESLPHMPKKGCGGGDVFDKGRSLLAVGVAQAMLARNRERKTTEETTYKQTFHGTVPGCSGHFVYVFFLPHKERAQKHMT